MIGLVISNQRGGVGKTTTAVNLAGYLTKLGRKVLLIDADSQGSVGSWFSVRPERFLANVIIQSESLSSCVTSINDNLDVLASNRTTQQAEAFLLGQVGRERALETLLEPQTRSYDWVLIDVAPSITLLQSCAMMYAGNILVPVAMDVLSLQGAYTSIETVKLLNQIYNRSIRIAGFLPTQVNTRLQVTQMAMETLEALSQKTGVPILHAIRVDQAVHRATRNRQFLYEHDPKCRATEDYDLAFAQLVSLLEVERGEAKTA